jgi:hypothetical protein
MPKIYLLLLILHLVGCAAQPLDTIPKDLRVDFRAESDSLYADLKNLNGQWRLSNINNKRGDILLNHLSPAKITEYSGKRCQRGFFGLTSGSCEGADSEWFYNRFSEDNLFIPVIWPVCLAFSALLPIIIVSNYFTEPSERTSLKDMDAVFFNLQFSPVFDTEKYRKAITDIQEDLAEKDLKLGSILGNYTNLMKKHAEYIAPEKAESNLLELNEITEKLLLEHQMGNKAFLYENLNFSIQDKSGLFNKILPDKTFLLEPEIYSKVGLPEYEAATVTQLKNKNDCMQQLLPAQDIFDFNQKLTLAIKCFNNLELENKQIHEANTILTMSANDQNEKSYHAFRRLLANTPLNISWRQKQSADYLLKNINYRLELPSDTALKNDESNPRMNAKLIIDSINFENVFPDDARAENEDISIQYQNSAFHIKNHSQNPIKLSSLTFKVNDSEINKPVSQLIEPDNDVKVLLSRDESLILKQTYPALTRKKAETQKLVTRIQLDYFSANNKEIKTVASTRAFSVVDLVD